MRRCAMKRQRILTGVLALGLLLPLTSLYLGPIPVAHTATITVNTTDDELNDDGDCSLREAIQAANTDSAVDGCTAGSGADTITLPAGYYTLTIAGANEEDNATGDLDILDDLTINGDGEGYTVIPKERECHKYQQWRKWTSFPSARTVRKSYTQCGSA